MRSPRIMLWTVALLLLCSLKLASSTEERQNATTYGNENNGDKDIRENDDILRIWIEYILNINKKNIQSSTDSYELKNIQRISKKSRTSSTSTTPIIKNKNIEPLPVYPILFRPYYHKNPYSNYITTTYGVKKHEYPISQVLYPQEDNPQQIFIPFHITHFPYSYPQISSSTPINNYDSKIIQTYIPENNQNETVVHNTLNNLLNQNTNEHTLPMEWNLEYPIQETHKTDETYSKPIRDKKLLYSEDISYPITTETIQSNYSPKIQQSLSTNVNKLYISSDKVNFPDFNSITSTPTSITSVDTSSLSEIFNESNASLITNLSDEINSKSLYLSSVTPRSKISKNNYNNTPTFKENEESIESHNNQNYINFSNYIDTTTENTHTLKTSVIKSEVKKMAINKTTPTPQILITFSPDDITSSNDKILHTNSYNDSIQMRSAYSTIQTTNIKNENNNQSYFSNSSITRPLPTSTIISETTLLHKTSQSPTFKIPLLQQFTINPIQSTNTELNLFKSNTPQSTNINNTALFPLLNSISSIKSTNSISIETKTEPTQSITTNLYNNYKTKIKQNTFIPIFNESTLSTSTNTIPISPSREFVNQNSITNGAQNNLPYSFNITPLSKSYLNHDNKEKSNTHNEEHTDHYFPVTTKEIKRNSMKSTIIPIKPRNNIEKNSSYVTASDDLKYKKSTTNQSRYTEKSMYPLNTMKESELWYNPMHNQNTPKKELNEEQINFLLQKLIKLLKPEIEKQAITQESVARFITPKYGDQDKLVYIILPWIRDAAKNVENKEQKESKINSLKTSDKI